MRRLAAAVALLVVVAGCASSGSGGEPIRASASPAIVGEDVLDAAGYRDGEPSTGHLNVTVSASIQGDVELHASRAVRATTARVVYRRGDAVFATYSVPAVTLLPQSARIVRNPAATLSTAELVERAQPTYADVSGLTESGTSTVSMLGNETTLTTYRGTATRGGESVDVAVLVATVRHDDAFVTAVAVSPATAEERGRVERLVGAVQAPGGA
jgi:hypothetical protein